MTLPASVQEIADVIGRERALHLIGQLPRCYAGTARKRSERVIMYVPKRLDFSGRGDIHPLVRILGWADAQKLVHAFGGEIMHPSTCPGVYRPYRDEQIARLVNDGVPVATVAQWFDVSDRLVKNVLREIPQEEVQAANDNNAASPMISGRRNDGQQAA